MKDFSRLHTSMYTVKVKVLVSQKWCNIEPLLLHATNKKYLHGLSIRAIFNDL